MGVDASYGGSKVARVLVPKVHINKKNNTTMEKKNVKNQCWMGPMWWLKSINKVHMKGCPSRKLFIICVRGKKNINPKKKTKIGTFEKKAQI